MGLTKETLFSSIDVYTTKLNEDKVAFRAIEFVTKNENIAQNQMRIYVKVLIKKS